MKFHHDHFEFPVPEDTQERHNADPYLSVLDVAAISQAISLKRIADVMERAENSLRGSELAHDLIKLGKLNVEAGLKEMGAGQ